MEIKDEKQFWMVFKDGNRYSNTRHETKELAQTEARRLASENHRDKFYVMEAVAVIMVDRPTPPVLTHILLP